MTDKPNSNSVTSVSSPDVSAAAVENVPQPATVAATIPEAGMCGFSFDINSIPDMARQ